MSSEPEPGRTPRCSDARGEPLPGTAKKGMIYLIVEHPHGWGRDVLDGEALGKDLADRISAKMKKAGAAFHLIRRPGRGRGTTDSRRAYLAFTSGPDPDAPPPSVEAFDLPGGVTDIFDIDLSGPGRNTGLGARTVTHPLVLVCTHGKRDVCCAVKGRPMASAMRAAASSAEGLVRRLSEAACGIGGVTAEPTVDTETAADTVWESSHTGGHRFAPSMILLPWGYSYGRMSTDQGMAMLGTLARGELPLPGLRGRGCVDGPGQAAEVAVAVELSSAGCPAAPGELVITDPGAGNVESVVRMVTRARTGEQWLVHLEHRSLGEVLKSCGKPPAAADAWEVTAISGVRNVR
ncbi:sucrase ferredoxin [Corynebacterium sp. CCM 9204]|uniref:sucrase ferredoxin n=1 Tax=Corynebacterium sp. CCM 9204 TaxID=3057616 RepID=UPI003525B71A